MNKLNRTLGDRMHWLFADAPDTSTKLPPEVKTILVSVVASVTSAIVLWYVLQLKPPWVSARLARKGYA